MKTQKSILQTINKTNFKKYVNYKLNNRGKVKRFSTFNSKTIIFEVIINKNNMLFNIDNCRFMSCSNYGKNMKAVFSLSIDNLPYIINEIEYFNRDIKSRDKMNFPVITLK